jgi:hypothetical protein
LLSSNHKSTQTCLYSCFMSNQMLESNQEYQQEPEDKD